MADLADTLNDPTVAPTSAPEDLADLLLADESGPARESVRLSKDIPQDKAAKVLQLRDKTGLSTDFLSRNTDAIQKQQDTSTITPEFVEKHPKVTSWVSDDTHNAALAGTDIPILGTIERQFSYMANQAERGALDTERSVRGMFKGLGMTSPDNDARMKHIATRLNTDLNRPAPGVVSNIFGKAVESVPMIATATGVGALAAMAKVPAAPATAAAFGAMEFGNAYLDYSERKDEHGVPKMDDSTARGFALITGVLNGAAFMLPVGKMMKDIPGLRMLSADGIHTAIENPATLSAFKVIAKRIGESGVMMGGFSGFSSLVHSAAGHLGEIKGDGSWKDASPIAILERIFPAEDFKAAAKSAGSGAVTGGVFGAVGGGFSALRPNEVHHAHNAVQAIQTADSWKAIGQTIKSTKMNEIAPEQMGNLIAKMAPDSHVYVPMEQWQTYFEKQKVDPRAAFEAAVGDTKAYDESMKTGADIQIPVSKYAANIAPSDHGEFFSNVVRRGPEAMNAEEAGRSIGLTRDIEKEQREATEKVRGDVVGEKPAEKASTVPEAVEAETTPEGKAVAAAQEEMGSKPLFVEPNTEGMNPDLSGKYRHAIDEAKAFAQEDVARKIADDAMRIKSRAWMDERESIEKEVEKDSWNHKEFVAREMLGQPVRTKAESEARATADRASYESAKREYDQWRELLRAGIKPDPTVAGELKQIPGWMKNKEGRGYDEFAQEAREKGLLGKGEDFFVKLRNIKRPEKPLSAEEFVPLIVQELAPFKLDRAAIERDFPDADLSLLRGMLSDTGGVHPDQAASLLGYNSGSELLYQLKTTPKRAEWIQEETDARMIERHPEPRTGDIMDEAMRAVHNEKRAQVLRLELQYLASEDFAAFKGLTRRITRRIPTTEEVRKEAEETIGAKTAVETAPLLYQRAESLAGHEAREHFLRGDFEKAFEAKTRELRNHELYRSAIAAKEQAAKDVAFASKYDSDAARARIGKAGSNYLEQIDSIRNAFDFSRTTQKAVESRQGLREWIQEQVDAGYAPTVPPDLLENANRKSWKELTNDELHTTVDAMRNIAHLAGLKNKLLASVKERTFDETRSDIINSLTKRYDITPDKLNKPYELHPDFMDKVKGDLNTFGAWRTRMEPLFQETGMHDILFEPTNVAENFQTSELRKSREKLNDIFSVYSKKEKARFGRVTYIPELEGSGLDPNMNKMEMIMTLLNGGNEGNMAEVLRGYKMTEAQLRGIWKHLEPRDVEIAQKIWDFVDSYWPLISKQERELNGLPPEKVKGRPLDVILADGSTHHLEGGYFPLVYDKDVSWRTAALGQDAMVKDMFPSYLSNTATKHNWTQARVGGGGQAPSLKFSVLTNHIFDVIHDLAYRKPTIDIYKLINDPDVQQHMQAGFGKGLYAQLNPWLKRIAGTREWDPLGPLEALKKIRSNMTVAELGLKLTSAFNDVASITPAINELGVGYMARGFKEFANIPAAIKFMFEKDESMRSRWEDSGDRDIRAAESMFNLVNTNPSFLSELKAMSPLELKDMWLPMRIMDIAVGGPIWYGSYLKAMEGHTEGIKALDERAAVSYAARVVRDIKGSGAAKDLSPFQGSNNQLIKMMSMFSSMLNVIDNQMLRGYRNYRVDKNLGKLMSVVLMNWFLPAVFSELASGRGPQQDDTWGGWSSKIIGEFPFQMMPLTKEAISFFDRGKYEISPVEEGVMSILRTAKNLAVKNPVGDKFTEDESGWTKKDFSDFIMSIGYLKGIPTRQIVQSTMRLHNWMSGDEQHESALGGIVGVVTGSRTDK